MDYKTNTMIYKTNNKYYKTKAMCYKRIDMYYKPLYDSNKSEEMTRTWLMWQEYKSDDENERDVWGSLDDLDD